MRKFWLIMGVLAILVLSACGKAAPTANPDTDAGDSAPTRPPIADGPAMQCDVFNVFPDAKDPASVKLPEITAADWSRGAEDAILTLVEYSDFQCPYCSLAGRTLKEFGAAHPDEVRIIYRHFPLNIHDKAPLSAQAADAAGVQGKFWEMHDFLVAEENWQVWTSQTPADFEKWIVEQAETLGLDTEKFSKDLTSKAIVDKVNQSSLTAQEIGLTSTPSFYYFINGELIFVPADQLPYDASMLNSIIALAKMQDRQYSQCPPTIIDGAKQYTATIKTEKGEIKLKLYADKAPLAVNSFVFLAQQGYFDGVTFHRVIADFVAQTGDPSGTGFGGPGYQFNNEVFEDMKFDRAGLVAMANSGADTNGSQFFITYKETPNLDGDFTIFGEVIDGMDVVEKLTPRNPDASQGLELPPGDKILSITIEEK